MLTYTAAKMTGRRQSEGGGQGRVWVWVWVVRYVHLKEDRCGMLVRWKGGGCACVRGGVVGAWLDCVSSSNNWPSWLAGLTNKLKLAFSIPAIGGGDKVA